MSTGHETRDVSREQAIKVAEATLASGVKLTPELAEAVAAAIRAVPNGNGKDASHPHRDAAEQ